MSKKAKDITVSETVFNRGTSFIVKEVRVETEHSWIGIAFLDTEGFWHGWYHPDEYLGVGPLGPGSRSAPCHYHRMGTYCLRHPHDRRRTRKRMDELAREFEKTHDEEVKAELEALRGRIVAMKRRLI